MEALIQDTSFDLFAPTTTDGYKVGHRPLYPNGTNFTYSNGTFRSDRLFLDNKSKSRFWDGKVVWFGMQGAMREINGLWQRSFFSKPKEAVCRRYARRMKHYLGEGRVSTKCFEDLHDLGYLPITVLSVKEGSRLDMNVPAYVAYNTHPDFYWLVNYLETVMSALIWKMTTNATIAYEYRRTMEYWAEVTGVPMSFVDIQGHDFSFRGMSGPEDAARCGTGHLVVFKGTDTLPAIDYAEDMYFADADTEFLACSVVATEHAVATANILFNAKKIAAKIDKMWTEAELRASGELAFLKEALTEKNPTGVISLVSDSFDFWKVITDIAALLKEDILARQPDVTGLAKVVFRPDSGDPIKVICGAALEIDELNSTEVYKALDAGYDHVTHGGKFYKAEYHRFGNLDCKFWEVEATPELKGALQCLWEIFGGTETEKHYKVLHERVGLIYGDSITVQRADEILRRLAKKGFASCNVVFGIGSYTYQHNSRDTHGFAVKATAVCVGDELIQLFKAPKTEKETVKKSAKGFLKVVQGADGIFRLHQEQEMAIDELWDSSGELLPVYHNSTFPAEVKLKEISERLLTKKPQVEEALAA